MSRSSVNKARLATILAQLDEFAQIVANSKSTEEVNNANQMRKFLEGENCFRALFKTYPEEVRVESMSIAQRNGVSVFKLLYDMDRNLFIEKLDKIYLGISNNQGKKAKIKVEAPSLDLALLNDPAIASFSDKLILLDRLFKEIATCEDSEIVEKKESLRSLISGSYFKAVFRQFDESERNLIIAQARALNTHEYFAAYFFNPEKFTNEYLGILKSHTPSEKPVSKSTERRHKAKAKALGLSLEEYKSSLKKKDKKRIQVRKEKLNAKQIELQKLANCNPPEPMSLTRWEDFESICELLGLDVDDKSSKSRIDAIKAIEFQYILGKSENRLETFKKGTNYMELSDIKAKVSNILSDTKMNEAEAKFERKVGSLQSQDYSTWMHKVYKLWQPIEFNPDEKVLDSAINKLRALLAEIIKPLLPEDSELDYLTPMSLETSYTKATKGRNSGYPFFTSKWHKNQEMVDYYMEEAQNLLEGKLVLDAPRILFSRTQYDGKTPKMRPIECPPKSEALAGKCFTSRILYAFKHNAKFCGFRGNNNIGREMREFILKYNTLISSDFSNFDATCTHLIPIVFDLVDEIFGYKYSEYFNGLKTYYRNSTLITPQGIIESQSVNGLQSGDSWTSVIGTLANALSNFYALERMGIEADFKSYGDDCVVGTNQDFDINSYELFMKELGMECNQDKQEMSSGNKRNCNFLGYYYFNEDCENENKSDDELNIFPIMRALSGLIYREHYVTADDLFNEAEADGMSEEELEIAKQANKAGIDLLGIISKMDNIKNHPDYDAFLNLFVQYHPNGCDPKLVFPFRNLLSYLKNAHRVYGVGLGSSYTFKKLVDYHNLHHLVWETEVTTRENFKPNETLMNNSETQKYSLQVIGGNRKHGKGRYFICKPMEIKPKHPTQLLLPPASTSDPETQKYSLEVVGGNRKHGKGRYFICKPTEIKLECPNQLLLSPAQEIVLLLNPVKEEINLVEKSVPKPNVNDELKKKREQSTQLLLNPVQGIKLLLSPVKEIIDAIESHSKQSVNYGIEKECKTERHTKIGVTLNEKHDVS